MKNSIFKCSFAATMIILVVIWSVIFVLRGKIDLIEIFDVNARFVSDVIVNFLVAFIVSYISFKEGIKAEHEKNEAEAAESENIKSFVKKLAVGNKIVTSSKAQRQIESLSSKEKDTISEFINLLSSRFENLLSSQQLNNVDKNVYLYRINSRQRLRFSKEGDVFIINEIINR